jgi:hypothetical protein
MKITWAQIIAIIEAIIAILFGQERTLLLSSVQEGCQPTLKWYKVCHFNSSHHWVCDKVQAYSASDAANKLGLKAGRNCFVSYLSG